MCQRERQRGCGRSWYIQRVPCLLVVIVTVVGRPGGDLKSMVRLMVCPRSVVGAKAGRDRIDMVERILLPPLQWRQ